MHTICISTFLYAKMRCTVLTLEHNIHILYMLHFFLNSIFVICMYLGGASLEVAFLFIYNNSICFVIIKKGEIVGSKAIYPSFDDNKAYEVMFSNNFI